MPDVVPLCPPSLQILGNILDGGDSDFRISGQSFLNKNYGNSRTSHDIDMKLGPGTKIYKRNKATSIKFDDDIVLTSFPSFRFMVNLKQSGSLSLEAWPIKLTFLLTVTFFLTETENRTKKQLSYYCLE